MRSPSGNATGTFAMLLRNVQGPYALGDTVVAQDNQHLGVVAAAAGVFQASGPGAIPVYAPVNLASGSYVTGVLRVANGGTGTGAAFTPGSVVFAGVAGIYAQDNANFFWDSTNHRLGIGVSTPSATLTLPSDGKIGWDNGSGTADVFLQRDGGADILAQKRGIHNQEFHIYGDATGSGKFLELRHIGSAAQVIAVGIGSAAPLQLGSSDNVWWELPTDASLRPVIDNLYNFGAPTQRPLNGFFSGSLQIGGTTVPSTKLELTHNSGSNYALELLNTAVSGRDWIISDGIVAAGKLSVYDNTASAHRIVIDSTGQIGIGLTNPSQILDVFSRFTVSTDGVVQWGDAGHAHGQLSWDTGKATIVGQSGKDLSLGSNNTVDQLYIKSGGNVGIGTAAPEHPLDISSSTANSILVRGGTVTGNNAFVTFGAYAAGDIGFQFGRSALSSGVAVIQGLKNGTGANNIGLNPSGGNVGIGTTSPQALLSVSDNATTLPAPFSGTVLQVGKSDGNTAIIEIDAFAANTNIRFRRANNTAASPSALSSGDTIGDIGAIGYKATGYSASAATLRFAAAENWTNTATGTYISFFTTAKTTTSLLERMRIDDAGNTGIGVSSMTGVGRLFPAGGTAVATTDWALTSGWGANATISAVTGTDQRGTVTVQTSALDTPTANPVITLTFKDGTWTSVPFAVANLNKTGTGLTGAVEVNTTATTLVLEYVGTPTALTAATYIFSYIVVG